VGDCRGREAAAARAGGKAVNIVFDDAPLDQAVEGIINAAYFNQGEVCCAGFRLLVQESIYEQPILKPKSRMGTLRVATRSTRTPTSARSRSTASTRRTFWRIQGTRLRPRGRTTRPRAVLGVRRMSADHFQGPPPISLLRRLVLLVAFVVGLIAVVGLIFGGALLLESFM